MSRPSLVLLLLAACGGEQAPTPAPAAAPTAAPAPAPAPAAAVGKDGPENISVPALAEVPTDPASIEKGKKVFEDRGCGGCHKFGEKLVGPDLTGLFGRRSIPWIERMVTDPAAMVKQDPQARELFKTLMVEMPKQNVPPEDLAPLLAYIKSQGG